MRPTRSLLLLLTLCLGLWGLAGCQQYGSVSDHAYEHAQALYSICNRRDTERLAIAEQSITAAYTANELTKTEQQWLQEIINQARAEDWESAAANARTIMAEQIQR